MSHDDFAFEPIPGLPERPPPGETVLWQGRPDAWIIARQALHVRVIAGYFALLALWRLGSFIQERGNVGDLLASFAVIAGLGALTLGFFALWAYAIGRTSIYTITSHRVVMRIGVALPITLNLPFSAISSADLRVYPNGAGDVVLTLLSDKRIGYAALWPHAKPWRVSHPQPMLRAIPDAKAVAETLTRAFAAQVPARLGDPVAAAEHKAGAATGILSTAAG